MVVRVRVRICHYKTYDTHRVREAPASGWMPAVWTKMRSRTDYLEPYLPFVFTIVMCRFYAGEALTMFVQYDAT